MSQRRGLKRRISFTEEPNGKKADRKASPPRVVFQAPEDADFDTNEVTVRLFDHDAPFISASHNNT
jgi:hypothetical protein